MVKCYSYPPFLFIMIIITHTLETYSLITICMSVAHLGRNFEYIRFFSLADFQILPECYFHFLTTNIAYIPKHLELCGISNKTFLVVQIWVFESIIYMSHSTYISLENTMLNFHRFTAVNRLWRPFWNIPALLYCHIEFVIFSIHSMIYFVS